MGDSLSVTHDNSQMNYPPDLRITLNDLRTVSSSVWHHCRYKTSILYDLTTLDFLRQKILKENWVKQRLNITVKKKLITRRLSLVISKEMIRLHTWSWDKYRPQIEGRRLCLTRERRPLGTLIYMVKRSLSDELQGITTLILVDSGNEQMMTDQMVHTKNAEDLWFILSKPLNLTHQDLFGFTHLRIKKQCSVKNKGVNKLKKKVY